MDEKTVKLWMPVTKNPLTGKYAAILTDTSLDRDDEAMSKELILGWGKSKGLPALANHENKMEKWVGGWENIKGIEKGEHSAVQAEPWFFSKEGNPLAAQIQKQVEEALEKGLNPGISISAIVREHETRKINGKDVRVYTKGEILEATWVPIQSNRNSNYGHVAKQFGLKKSEVSNMEQKDVDTAVKKAVDEKKVEFDKELKTKSNEIDSLKKEFKAEKDKVKALETEKTDLETKNKDLVTVKEAADVKVKALEKDVEDAKKTALHKQHFQNMNGEVATPEDEATAIKDGKLPVVKMER